MKLMLKKSNFKINKYIKNSLIASFVLIIFLLFDLLTKSKNFIPQDSYNSSGEVQHDFGIIGIRSLAHDSSTFLSFLHFKFSYWSKNFLNILIAIFVVVAIVLVKRNMEVIALSILLAGILGNTFDTLFFNYVRDIFFTPWLDRGTFNGADVFIIVGSGLLIIALLRNLWSSEKRQNER